MKATTKPTTTTTTTNPTTTTKPAASEATPVPAPKSSPAPKATRTRGVRTTKPAAAPPPTLSDLIPSAVILPAGIAEPDPARALPLVVTQLRASEAAHRQTLAELESTKADLEGTRASLDASAQSIKDYETKLAKALSEVEKTEAELEKALRNKRLFDNALEDLAKVCRPSDAIEGFGWKWTAGYLGEVKEALARLQSEKTKIAAVRDGHLRKLENIAGLFEMHDKVVGSTDRLVEAVNLVFMERNNARASAEVASNNVNRLKAELERAEGALGKIFTKAKKIIPSIEGYDDVEQVIEEIAGAQKILSQDLDDIVEEASEWRGRAICMGIGLGLGALYIGLHLMGVAR